MHNVYGCVANMQQHYHYIIINMYSQARWAAVHHPNQIKKTHTDFARNLPFGRNQPLKSADEQCIGILRNNIENLGRLK
jgi:hypothetical protein